MTAAACPIDPLAPRSRRIAARAARAAGVLGLLLWLSMLAACSTPGDHRESGVVQASQTSAPIVLLVSIDGFRAEYLERGLTPRLQALARQGVRATSMRPSYPTLTFPNHYTLVTGRRPDHHGVVGNTMDDPVLGRFYSGDGHSAADGRWFDDAEPLWVTVRRHGLVSATMFWPGSDAEIRGVRPNHWRPYREAASSAERVAGVLGWLDLPAAERPRLVALYFDAVDQAGHHNGPDSAALADALRNVDLAMGQLLDGIAARGLGDAVDLLVVSDHGMAGVHPEQFVLLDDLVDPAALATMLLGEHSSLTPRPARRDEVERGLLGRHGAVECWKREALPSQWHFGRHRRVAPIICQADEGWRLERRDGLGADGGRVNLGGHGYAPSLDSMQAIFIASGPSFRRGVEVTAFDNVEVYPLLARLLGVAPQPHDGEGVLIGRVLRGH